MALWWQTLLAQIVLIPLMFIFFALFIGGSVIIGCWLLSCLLSLPEIFCGLGHLAWIRGKRWAEELSQTLDKVEGREPKHKSEESKV